MPPHAAGARSWSRARREDDDADERLRRLSHDLRTSLTVIRGEVELVLANQHAAADEVRRSVAVVVDEVERAEAILLRHAAGASTPTAPSRSARGRR